MIKKEVDSEPVVEEESILGLQDEQLTHTVLSFIVPFVITITQNFVEKFCMLR